jgi:hypothetical protein
MQLIRDKERGCERPSEKRQEVDVKAIVAGGDTIRNGTRSEIIASHNAASVLASLLVGMRRPYKDKQSTL